MSKRLQVILQDADYSEIQRCARGQQLTVAEWVRRALVVAQHERPAGDAGRKLDTVREAARCAYPTAEIKRMMAEVDAGYRAADA